VDYIPSESERFYFSTVKLTIPSKEELKDRMNHCGQHHRGRPDIVKRSNSAQGFEVSPKPWIVERTL
jgi:hypothetical protein